MEVFNRVKDLECDDLSQTEFDALPRRVQMQITQLNEWKFSRRLDIDYLDLDQRFLKQYDESYEKLSQLTESELLDVRLYEQRRKDNACLPPTEDDLKPRYDYDRDAMRDFPHNQKRREFLIKSIACYKAEIEFYSDMIALLENNWKMECKSEN
jgi:hypothetical protein